MNKLIISRRLSPATLLLAFLAVTTPRGTPKSRMASAAYGK